MPEKMNFSPENNDKKPLEKMEFKDVVFTKIDKKDGQIEYKSSAPNRKIILLSEGSSVPVTGYPYKVRVIEDTNPGDPLNGKLVVEIINSDEGSIVETEESISYLGVKLDKAASTTGQFIPKREQYADFINDKEISLPLQRDIAVSFLSGEPLLVEGGTSLGKTTTVKKMAAELGWEVHYANLNGATDVEDLMGRYIPNPNKIDPADPEYIFADGKVTSGLRQEEGKVKVVILDEFNASAPNILIRLHEVLDALERGGEVVLSEDASEAVPVNKGKTKVIALMNPPGKGYFSREPLDPAQLRRWVYKKLPSELPDSTFSHSTDTLFGADVGVQHITPDMFIAAREHPLTPAQLQEIPGIQEILEKYKEFHKATKEILRNRKIAADQPQPFMYDDRMEPRRVRDFILRFFNGDLNQTFQQALRYYYANKLESDSDRKKINELIRLVEHHAITVDSKRKGLERKKEPKANNTPEAKPRAGLELAIEKLGRENVFGPEEVKQTWGVTLDKVPEIPFGKEELERAEKLGQMLVLRIDKDANGKPLSMSAMNDLMVKKWLKDGKGEMFNTADGWKGFVGEKFFTEEVPRTGWALVSKEVLPNSTSKNYVEQTEILIQTLLDKSFKDLGVPVLYTEAIEEFKAKRKELNDLMASGDWANAVKQLAQLKITQLTRQTAPETVYDLAMYHDRNNKRLLPSTYTWTASLSPGGRLVDVGSFGGAGVFGNGWLPDDRDGAIGVSLSRRL